MLLAGQWLAIDTPLHSKESSRSGQRSVLADYGSWRAYGKADVSPKLAGRRSTHSTVMLSLLPRSSAALTSAEAALLSALRTLLLDASSLSNLTKGSGGEGVRG